MANDANISMQSYIKAIYIKLQLIFGKNILKNTIRLLVALSLILIITLSIMNTSQRQTLEKKPEQTQPATTDLQKSQDAIKPQEHTKEVQSVTDDNKEQIFHAHIDKAIQYSNEGQYEQALQEVNKSIAMDTDNAIAYQVRGLIYSQMNMQNKALEDLTKSCNLGDKESCRYAEEVKVKVN